MRENTKTRSTRRKPDHLPYGSTGPCALLSECQSCPLLPLSIHEQRAHKLSDLEECLSHYTSLSATRPILSPSTTSDTHAYGYRCTVKPSVRAGQDPLNDLQIGLYRPMSHDLVDLSGCLVQDPELNHLLDLIRDLAPLYGLRGYQQGDEAVRSDLAVPVDETVIRYVVARKGLDRSEGATPSLHLTLICTSYVASKLDALIHALSAASPHLIGVSVHQNRSLGNAIFDYSSPTCHIWGESRLSYLFQLSDDAPPLACQISSESFAQVNPLVAEQAYREMIFALDPRPGDRVIDLYCGVGVIGLGLAQAARLKGGALHSLWGFEESPSSVCDAEENARHAHISEAYFSLGRAEDRLADFVQNQDQDIHENTPLLVSLNPSRRGCQPEVLNQLLRLRPHRVAYMSCHPRTLARDLDHLCQRGYQLKRITLFDMFPGSLHYETVSLLHAT